MSKPSFKVFLSHRYESPFANQHFFDVLTQFADIQFEVDVGTKATNVTRLERLIRDSDAFVGIYPFPSDGGARPDLKSALAQSRYFRLELDMAIRARRPAIIFVDERYGTAITVPDTIRAIRYNDALIGSAGSDSQTRAVRQTAKTFCSEVAAWVRLGLARQQRSTQDRVGLFLPQTSAYSVDQIKKLTDQLTDMALEPVHLDCHAPVDAAFLAQLQSLDWTIVDIGEETCAGGLPAFLHGYFIPQMRMLRVTSGDAAIRSPLERTLLASFDVGYPKDIVRWADDQTLFSEFRKRLTRLYEPPKSIRTSAEAEKYFLSAAKRNETVFLSYTKEDADYADALYQILKKKFQDVFNYRDRGESIVPGRPWIEQIYDKMAKSALGIALLSPAYLQSGNCVHEAEQMVANTDAGKIIFIPVKIKADALDLPAWLEQTQYLRAWQYTPAELVDNIVASYDAHKRV